ncbi:MAG: hypothetical protein IJ587_04475 [Synergistaceae bacterium]|nr:hypothetical protein [Synergistaceae bacterium]
MKKILITLLITATVSTSALGATSNDVYLRQDIFEAKMDAFIAEIKLMNEQTRTELRKEIQDTKSELKKEIQDTKSELNAKIQANATAIQELKADIQATNSRIDVTNTRLDDLYTMVYWGLALMAIIITFAALAPSLLQVVKGLFQPRFTLEDIERIIDAKLSNKTASI